MEVDLNIEDIRTLLPHRFPMLLVDRVTDLVPGRTITALKNVTINEPFFSGHFPRQAVMPGVLILESLAQAAALMMLGLPENHHKIAFIGAIDNVRFRKPVVPGDTLVMSATLLNMRGAIGKVRQEARVNDTLVAECEMTFAIKEPEPEGQVYGKLDAIADGTTRAVV